MTNETAFNKLQKTCSGGHLHQHLVGGVRVKIDGLWTYKNRTALAGVYPPKLCLGWARVGAF